VVLAERRQWNEAGPYVASALVHAALVLAVSWLLIKPHDISDEEAIGVRIIDQKELAKAEQPPIAASPPPQPRADTGVGHDAIHLPDANLGKPEPLIQGLLRMENGWYRSETMLSEAEISNPKHERLRAQLGQLESNTRTVQICNLEAILQITRSGLEFHPMAVVDYAMADVVAKGDTVVANGAAFQSDGKWYNLSFRCRISSRSRQVQGFEFVIGQTIPREDWKAHSLPNRPVGLADD
jgi:Domain of Unknown Function (DUF930)